MNAEVRAELQYVLLLQQSKLEWHLEMFSVLFYTSAFHGSALNIYLSV
jgi:hypothetical protein